MAHNIFSELPEMIIGKEAIAPGINLIFEGAIKDDVSPAEKFGYEKDSDMYMSRSNIQVQVQHAGGQGNLV